MLGGVLSPVPTPGEHLLWPPGLPSLWSREPSRILPQPAGLARLDTPPAPVCPRQPGGDPAGVATGAHVCGCLCVHMCVSVRVRVCPCVCDEGRSQSLRNGVLSPPCPPRAAHVLSASHFLMWDMERGRGAAPEALGPWASLSSPLPRQDKSGFLCLVGVGGHLPPGIQQLSPPPPRPAFAEEFSHAGAFCVSDVGPRGGRDAVSMTGASVKRIDDRGAGKGWQEGSPC